MANFLNITFPIVDDNLNNFFLGSDKTTEEIIKSHIRFFLTSTIGERYYKRDYGTTLKTNLFELNNSTTYSLIEKNIRESTNTFFPKLIINGINFSQDSSGNENMVLVDINYSYKDNYLSFNENISLEFQDSGF